VIIAFLNLKKKGDMKLLFGLQHFTRKHGKHKICEFPKLENIFSGEIECALAKFAQLNLVQKGTVEDSTQVTQI